MSNVLIVQNSRIEGPGNLKNLLESDGFDLQTVYAKKEELPQGDYSLGIILGAPESANDDFDYLRKEQKLIQNFVENNIPILGICLGSQLVAKTFGARVYKGPRKEIGFYKDLEHIGNSKFFQGIKNPFTVFHWHGDTFDLPDGATRIVQSIDYPNQAFQYKTAVGLQFHLEVDETMVRLWLDRTKERIEKIPYISPDKIRSDIDRNISTVNDNLKKFYKNFKSTFDL